MNRHVGDVGRTGGFLLLFQALVMWALPALAGEAASEWQAGEKAQVRLIAATSSVGQLTTVPIGLEVRLEPGWKTYWRSPGDAGIPPHVDWEGSGNVAETDFLYPAPERFSYYDLETFGYGDRVVYPIDVRPEEPGKPLNLRANVDLLVCADVCIPHSMSVALDLPEGPADPSQHANLLSRFRSQVPGDGARAGLALENSALAGTLEKPIVRVAFTATEPFVDPDLLIEGPEFVFFGKPELRINEGGRRLVVSVGAEDAFGEPGPIDVTSEPLVVTLIDGERAMEAQISPAFGPLGGGAASGISFWAILALALVGGLILNLMPCVLPVLSIKLLSVVGHGGGDPRHVRIGFLAATAGIVSSFLLLATGLAVLKLAGSAVGWGIQFQQPAFIIAMVAILTLFATNLLGLFEIRLPGRISDVAVTHSGGTRLGGHFLSGAFATLLATPCSAPFLGTAVGFALSRGALETYAVFAALGIGMATPFLAVAAFPKVATKLPRPGPWMVTLKRVLSLALVATAIWLLSVLAAQVSLTAAVAVGVFMLVAAVLIAARGRIPARLGRAVPAGVLGAMVLAFLTPVTLPTVASPATGPAADIVWRPFDRGSILELVSAGQVVFVDVTADWCITCQVNKKRVLEAGEVARTLAADGVVAMRADWTRPSEEISDYLASFSRFGIPFNVIYGPDAPAGVPLPELLSSNAVLDAFSEAGRTFETVSR
ncbi:MAG: protein-disulfide reductase DsbD family protein [Alphaproteobacteria bacterium]